MNAIWPNYKYIQFAGATTYNGQPLRWIIIGAGSNSLNVLPSDVPDSVYSTKDGAIKNGDGMSANQILLLSEACLTTSATAHSWNSSSIRTTINSTDFLSALGISNYVGADKYIKPTKLYTANTAASCEETTGDYLFLLASRYGWFSGDGNFASANGETKGLQRFKDQNFCVEDYLGTTTVATKYTKTGSAQEYVSGDCARGISNAPKLASFYGASNSYWWLRSGYYDYSNNAYRVDYRGYVSITGMFNSDYAVRPSFVLNLSA